MESIRSQRVARRSWDTFLFSDDTSIGVVDGVRVVMKKPARGAGLLITRPSSCSPPDRTRRHEPQVRSLPVEFEDGIRRVA